MIKLVPVMYVDVGFCAILDEIEQSFGTGLTDIESISAAISNDPDFKEDWADETLKVLESVVKEAERKKFGGDVVFYK